MKTNPKKKVAAPKPTSKRKKPPVKKMLALHLPPGAKLSDIFIDAADVASELKVSKRTLNNWRNTGKVSSTGDFGKLFYFKQEIAASLFSGRKISRIKSKRRKGL